MRAIFFISDTHLFHGNILGFKDDNEKLIRPGFKSIEEMNETIVERWNSVVKDGDKVYHLGDVTFDYGKDFDVLMARLRGSKRLLLGNHDIIKGTNLTKHFKKVQLWRIFKEYGFICSHIPLREDQLRANCQFNVHGHLHQNLVREKREGLGHLVPQTNPDLRYMNVCVEHTNFTPRSLDEIVIEMANRRHYH